MHESIQNKELKEDDVISFEPSESANTARFKYLKNVIEFAIQNSDGIADTVNGYMRGSSIYIDTRKMFKDGLDCEILKIGSTRWQKGRFKVSLQARFEFYPDESEIIDNTETEQEKKDFPLDSVRKEINQAVVNDNKN